MTDKKMKKGFTLIEIVIVLAIAALIMVVVFLAVQGAQRAQRDNFRRETANRLLSAAASYRGNHSGAAAASASALSGYMTNLAANGVTISLDADTSPSACNSNDNVLTYIPGTPDQASISLESDDCYAPQS